MKQNTQQEVEEMTPPKNTFQQEWFEAMTLDPHPEFCKICMEKTIPIRDP